MRLRNALLFLLFVTTAASGQTVEETRAATKTTEEVVMRHMNLVLRNDLKGMLRNMGETITLISPNGPRVYSQEEYYKNFEQSFATQPRTFRIARTAFAGNMGTVICTDNVGLPEEYQFAETFYVEKGKIVAYSRVNFLPCPEGACKRIPAPAKK
jgi:hypothetical protein